MLEAAVRSLQRHLSTAVPPCTDAASAASAATRAQAVNAKQPDRATAGSACRIPATLRASCALGALQPRASKDDRWGDHTGKALPGAPLTLLAKLEPDAGPIQRSAISFAPSPTNTAPHAASIGRRSLR
jgi:hypothetical protein